MTEEKLEDAEIQVRPASPEGGAGSAPVRWMPWMRWRVYVSFILGMSAATFLLLCLFPHAIVLGWFALGFGLPAWLIGRKEVAEFPEAAAHGFIKWGIRTGMLSTILGPLSAIAWIAIAVAVGIRFH